MKTFLVAFNNEAEIEAENEEKAVDKFWEDYYDSIAQNLGYWTTVYEFETEEELKHLTKEKKYIEQRLLELEELGIK